MANTRIYRDWSQEESEEDEGYEQRFEPVRHSFDRRTPSIPRKSSSRVDTPQTAILSPKESDEDAFYSVHDQGIGTARTTDDPYYGANNANGYTKYDSESSRENEPSEPTLNPAQVETVPSFEGDYGAMPTDIRKQKRGITPSITSSSETSGYTGKNTLGAAAGRMPEFFSYNVFQTVLHNPTISHQLHKFGESRFCGENLDFLTRVNKYHAMLAEVTKAMAEIYRDFVSARAMNQINLPEPLLQKTKMGMKAAQNTSLPGLESVFVDAQADIERLVYHDVYPKFVRHQMTLSAAKALGTDRTKYAGLGDCFVLTDPAKADNPIVFASDGFVKVSGYTRNEIIPRNCRFLQSRYTDQASVRRLKADIEKRQESVELLLNVKKNGEPFWNLLYTTPLFDERGNLVFFLGGQINCSTTVHSASDVLRILAQADEPEKQDTAADLASSQVPKTPRRSILSAFRTPSKSNIQQRAPGMENVLLNTLEEMPLKNQISTFHSAYSNYIVINYSTFLISFVSPGIIDLLFPIKAKSAYQAQAIGIDIFKFLANHGSGNMSSDFKSTVKSRLKSGQAVSLDLKLCARPYMGFERFVLHWTPLKDERGSVSWVVLTLGNEARALARTI